MAESSGSFKASNGHVNGKVNGNYGRRTISTRRRRGVFSWMFSVATRLTIWAAILTVVFRCPPSLEDCTQDSPYICKPYFQAKHYISPRVQPYYDQYASPYVETARPYYEAADRTVLKPARQYAVQYGAPWVEKGQQQVLEQWHKNAQPQLVRIQSTAQAKYDQSVAPYLTQASDAVGPYYEIARTNGLQLYYENLLPTYNFVQPYAMRSYVVASDVTTKTLIPTATWAWNKTYIFIDTTVWPQVRAIYLENVEPQLVRIGERLGRYKTNPNSQTIFSESSTSIASDGTTSSFSKPAPQSSSVSSSSTSSETATVVETVVAESTATESETPTAEPSVAETDADKKKKVSDMVVEDIELWRKKFATQAEEGAAAIEEAVSQLSQAMIETKAQTVGKELVDQLEATVTLEVDSLKTKILALVEDSEKSATELEDSVVGEIRAAGMGIREKAQTIREWRKTYDTDLQSAVADAADHHLKILDEARSLTLQHIGMKWAWTDGVTHKDWTQYQTLKNTLANWTDTIKEHIVSFPSLLEAQDASAQVEDEAMEIAANAAKELARLKEVAHYKVLAQDTSDNFETDAMKTAAEAFQKARQEEQLAAESAKAAAEAAAQELADATASASEAYDDAQSSGASVASSAGGIAHDEATEAARSVEEQSTAASQSASSMLSEGDDAVSEAGEELSSTAAEAISSASSVEGVIVEEVTASAAGAKASVESVAEEASATAAEFLSAASESISSVVSNAPSASEDEEAESREPLASEESATMMGDTQTIVGNLSEVPPVAAESQHDTNEEEYDEAIPEEPVESATATVKPAMFGAAAQKVSERQPILDDYVDTDQIASVTNGAEAAYSNAVAAAAEQYSSAVSVVSAQIYGTPEPVHNELFSSVSGAYDNALAQASSRFHDVVNAASTGVYGTPTETSTPSVVDWTKVEAIAAQRLNEGRLWAEVQYQSALIAMGLATATPTSSTEKFYNQAKYNYYAGLGIAQDRYSSFLAAASSAMHSITATPTPTPTDFAGTASSIASVARESGASAVHAAEDAAESVYSAAADSVAQAGEAADEYLASAASAAADNVYIAGSALAESWNDVVASLSGQIYGEQPTPIGWYASITSEAGAAVTDNAAVASAKAAKEYDAVSELVSELISGKEPSFTESVLSRLGAAYSTASSFADKVGSAASEATEAVKETVQHGKDEL